MPSETIQVRIVWVDDACPEASQEPDGSVIRQHTVAVPAGATIAQALAALAASAPADAAGLRTRVADGRLSVAIFGRPSAETTVLHDEDRIELVGPLWTDPKQARQHRVQQQRGSGRDDRWRRRGQS